MMTIAKSVIKTPNTGATQDHTKPDPYRGLKGHAYIAARGLGKLTRPVQTSALTEARIGEAK
jgi:hypothetical protein